LKSKPTAVLTNMLTRAAILATEDIKSQVVQVPEWGGAVLVKGMTGTMRDKWEISVSSDAKATTTNARAKLVVCSVVDDAGTPIFTDADIEALGNKSGAALTRVAEVAMRLSGLRTQDLDDAVKN